jgi:NAD(P)-dependent dehydrogenase (short-subunit alcohol dehydrogenase family)
MADLQGASILVVGGSSGIGEAIALSASAAGARVAIASRSEDKLRAAAERIGAGVQTIPVDILDDRSVSALAAAAGSVDHLVITASLVESRPVRDLPTEAAMASMNSKFFGAYRLVRAVRVPETGSITLVSGIASRKHLPGMALLGAVNAALEALGKGLAAELAPTRVNVIAPGLVDTPFYDAMGPDAKAAFLKQFASRLPVGRVGRPEDIASAALLLMTNGYATGSVLDIDGGGLLN